MPIEQRKILFSFHEMQTVLQPHQMAFSNAIPSNPNQYKITEALLTREMTKAPHDLVARLRPGIEMAKKHGAAIVFRAVHTSTNKEFFFSVPDAAMEKILIDDCHNRGISLPRKGQKRVVIEDLYLGLQMDIAEETATFELE